LGFALASGHSWFAGDTTLILMVVVLLTGSQFSLPLLHQKTLQNLPLGLITTGLFGLLYGGNVYLITLAMEPMHFMQPQPLNAFYMIGIIMLILPWLSMLFIRDYEKNKRWQTWILKGYVTALNAAQPHPKTVTSHRNQYNYR